MQEKKEKILIVDDSEMNRSILNDMLNDKYEILEVENGQEAVTFFQNSINEISLVLLDIVMPVMDGFEVLKAMTEHGWIEYCPVVMISAESSSEHINKAYAYGAADFISRPFNALIVRHRVVNTIMLHAKQKKLVALVEEQIFEKEKRSNMLIDILGHIVEFRNRESGLHIHHVRMITEILLETLDRISDDYHFSSEEISLISSASALHDIGKIAVPHEILNKPGRLTDEEYQIMKTHTLSGAAMLDDMPFYQNEDLVKIIYEICRWHHERYDGRGYPDGLKGDDIPITAQVVSIADVYDALTSQRIYKKPIPHETAIRMICEGKCGSFQPLLLECLKQSTDTIRHRLTHAQSALHSVKVKSLTESILAHEELEASERTLHLLEHERMKHRFFASLTDDIQFEFTVNPPMLLLSGTGAEILGVDEVVMDPLHNESLICLFHEEDVPVFLSRVESLTPDEPVTQGDYRMHLHGEMRWVRIITRSIWLDNDQPELKGAFGKIIDIHDEYTKRTELQHMAEHDMLTGILNHYRAKRIISQRVSEHLCSVPKPNFALALIDLDYFKTANDEHGHLFGDRLLKHFAKRIDTAVRCNDIVARVGGDEFMIFVEYTDPNIHSFVDRIFHSIFGEYEGFTISISMGIITSEETESTDYDELFHMADLALYTAKRRGRGQYCFYDESMSGTLSAISQIAEPDLEEEPQFF